MFSWTSLGCLSLSSYSQSIRYLFMSHLNSLNSLMMFMFAFLKSVPWCSSRWLSLKKTFLGLLGFIECNTVLAIGKVFI